MPEFLMRRIGPLPVWGYALIVVIGGVAFYIWWRHFSNVNAANQAQSTSGVAGANPAYNPLNPNNDPNIDPNTGVPYQIEQAINPNTGTPYYYSSQGTPGTPSAPGTPNPNSLSYPGGQTLGPGGTNYTTPGSKPGQTLGQIITSIFGPLTAGQQAIALQDIVGANQYAGGLSSGDTAQTKVSPGATIYIPQIPYSSLYPGGNPPSSAAAGQWHTVSTVGNTGQTAPLSAIAMQQYGTLGTTQNGAATQGIINANPSLAGQPPNYQPPVGSQIFIPGM